VTIQNFSGDQVNVICRCTVEVSWGEHSCFTTVLVQKEALQDFLVGTNLLSKLGFCVLQPSSDGRMVDPLGSGDWKLNPSPVEATVTAICVTQVSDDNQLVLYIVNYGYQPV